MPESIHCSRCQRDVPRMERVPMPGKVGEEIQAKICSGCWADWQRAEVMVINEFQLDFMDPGAQEVLTRHLREFLLLDTPTDTPPESEAPSQ